MPVRPVALQAEGVETSLARFSALTLRAETRAVVYLPPLQSCGKGMEFRREEEPSSVAYLQGLAL